MLELMNRIQYPIEEEDGKMLEICFPDAKCNMNCEYCYGNHKTRPCNNSRPLNKEELKKQILPIKDNISFVHLWGGELLYNKEFFTDAVSFVHEILPGKDINMVSNGLLLPEWVDYLIENRIHLALSHDGPGQKYRGFDFLESKPHLNAVIKLYNAGLFNCFKVVIHSKNHSFKEINEYFDNFNKKYNIKVMHENLLIQSNSTNAFVFKPEDFSSLREDLVWKIKDIARNLNNTEYLKYHYDPKDMYQISTTFRILTKNNIPFIQACNGTRVYSFTSDGKKVPCHCFVEKDSNIQNLEFDAASYFKDCMDCEVGPLCNGGCIAKSIEEKKITCEFSKFYYGVYLEVLKSLIEEPKDE